MREQSCFTRWTQLERAEAAMGGQTQHNLRYLSILSPFVENEVSSFQRDAYNQTLDIVIGFVWASPYPDDYAEF
jgi:hypothetical protein